MSDVSITEERHLSYVKVGEGARCIVLLHGIMGSKKNLLSFGQKIARENPEYFIVIFDLRNHGESSKNWLPFSVEACAHDIAIACEKLDLMVEKLIGHSFSGKVSLLAAQKIPSVKQVWLLDCPPGPIKQRHPLSSEEQLSVPQIIEALTNVAWPVASRKALLQDLMKLGVSQAIATWMTTNLIERNHGLYLVFDPKDIQRMLDDFLTLDLWPVVDELNQRCEVHIVAASQSLRLGSLDEQRLAQLRPMQQLFHPLEKSGHFVHSDNPEGLLEIFRRYF